MTQEGDYFVFASGKRLSFNCAIAGLHQLPNGAFSITEGYDTGVMPVPYDDDEEHPPPLNLDEVIELADYEIALWGKLKRVLEVQRLFPPR